MWRARVKELYVYPVKSARGTALQSAVMTAAGLPHDREWMLVDSRGRFLSQRTAPQLARLPVRATAQSLTLGPAAGLEELTVPIPDAAHEVSIEVWSHRGMAQDAGDVAADWCSRFLGNAVRLVHAGASHRRMADSRRTAGADVPVRFSDGFPLLVTNQASLEILADHVGQTLDMRAFRPNIVLEGLPPWAEDEIASLEIGAVSVRLCKPCVRCVIPSLNPDTGEPGIDPTPTLRRRRWNAELRGVTFGENAYATGGLGAMLSIGDEVRCLPRSAHDAR